MRIIVSNKQLSFPLYIISGLILTACGGGDGTTAVPAPAQQATVLLAAAATPADATPAPAAAAASIVEYKNSGMRAGTTKESAFPTPVPMKPSSTTTSNLVTDLQIESTASIAQTKVPLTFGQVFAPGQILPSMTLVGKLPDGSFLPLQIDIKAKHDDGSLRHGIISLALPSLASKDSVTLGLEKAAAIVTQTSSTTPAALLSSGFSASVHTVINGQEYTASADAMLRSGKYTSWLSGPVVNEWLVSGPLKNANGSLHPHLSARFAIRAIQGESRARVDVTIENNWAYEPAPQNFIYDARIVVGGQQVYSKNAMTHYHHARWRKVFWWGVAPQLHVRHNVPYLLASKALPNFDQSVTVSETTLSTMKAGWYGAKTEPMGVGVAMAYMPTTGGRPDIGLLPSWAASYLLSMDQRAKEVTLGTADLAGSWSMHYRDKNTDRPISIADYPYMTILGRSTDTYNPLTKKYESFPGCAVGASCTTVNTHDTAHQPGFTYLPYLVTGDHYYLEELQFWTMWNTFSSHPGYRDSVKGHYRADQVRGQAWSLRTLSQAAYITPDNDALKGQLLTFLSNNLDWYNASYSDSASANQLGIVVNGFAFEYQGNTAIAPWQDDFFTSAIGHAAELGFAKAKPLLVWKSTFPVSRMIGAGTCWIDGAIYSIKVKDSTSGPLYTTIGQASQATHTLLYNLMPCASTEMAALLKLLVGEMTGFSNVVSGYPSNMQPALAYSADSGSTGAAAAWSVFMGRSVKPDYALGPQFAIVPR